MFNAKYRKILPVSLQLPQTYRSLAQKDRNNVQDFLDNSRIDIRIFPGANNLTCIQIFSKFPNPPQNCVQINQNLQVEDCFRKKRSFSLMANTNFLCAGWRRSTIFAVIEEEQSNHELTFDRIGNAASSERDDNEVNNQWDQEPYIVDEIVTKLEDLLVQSKFKEVGKKRQPTMKNYINPGSTLSVQQKVKLQMLHQLKQKKCIKKFMADSQKRKTDLK